MKTNKVSIAGYIVGVIIVASAIFRYAVVYEDLGRLLQWSLLGILLIGFSINYQNVRNIDHRVNNFVNEIVK